MFPQFGNVVDPSDRPTQNTNSKLYRYKNYQVAPFPTAASTAEARSRWKCVVTGDTTGPSSESASQLCLPLALAGTLLTTSEMPCAPSSRSKSFSLSLSSDELTELVAGV